ncbi:unnamed protein product [Phyllotreta striolata]|uniref:Uncharacterized protein n=1 Tax=Phyllotreta striolata TaxID=444603 RepID=A0A9N9TE42_PHYSR|nr:unnamed protein product [Phyllotreta striolata]
MCYCWLSLIVDFNSMFIVNTLILINVLVIQTNGIQKCGGITYDKKNFALMTMKQEKSARSADCSRQIEEKYDHIFSAEANIWIIEKNNPWLYFKLTSMNKTKWYCTPIMREFSPICQIKYYNTDIDNIAVFESRMLKTSKLKDTNDIDYSKYLKTGCDNQEKMEDYFQKCLNNTSASKTVNPTKAAESPSILPSLNLGNTIRKNINSLLTANLLLLLFYAK